MVKSRKRSKS